MTHKIPQDLFKFVENAQNDIRALDYTLTDFFRQRQSNPYVVLAALSDVVNCIIEQNFIDAEDADHLRFLTYQTLEAYKNTILGAAEEVMRDRFNESFFDGEEGANDNGFRIGSRG